jgi:hypothetical protein
VVGSRRRRKSAVGNQRRQAGEEVESAGSGFMELAVSSSGGRCGDRGARRWPEVALDGKVALATEGGGRLGASTVACSGRWLSGRHGVVQRRMRAVRDGQRLEERSAATREHKSVVRAERSGRRLAAVTGRGETASPTDQ